MTKLKNRLKKSVYIIGITLMIISIIGMTTEGSIQAIQPDNSTAVNSIIPNPILNANVSESTHYSHWTSLEYNNGTGNATLHANLSNFYKNPYTINPTDIESPTLQQKVAGIQWQNTSEYSISSNNLTTTTGKITNSSTSITFSGTSTGTTSSHMHYVLSLLVANMPTANTQYDYLTLIEHTTSTTKTSNPFVLTIWTYPVTGGTANTVYIQDQTANVTTGNLSTGTEYFSMPLSSLAKITNSPCIRLSFTQLMPANSDTITTTITGMAITETPLTLGSMDYKNQTITPTAAIGNLHLQTFNPNFAYKEISNAGYQVSISQSLQNLSIDKSSINDGKYTEEATYQGTLQMPTAPDLSYGNANITMQISIPGAQFKVFTISGQSYINSINPMKNGTFVQTNINPTHSNSLIVEVYYTATQWDKVSQAPSFWSNPIGTIEYYWYIALGGVLGLIGLGAGLKNKSAGFRGPKR